MSEETANDAKMETAEQESKVEQTEGNVTEQASTSAGGETLEELGEEEGDEARLRGGGKVSAGGGRNARRYAPYRSGGAGGGGGEGGGDDDTRGRRVYVGNLSWNVSWQDLKDHMRSAGEVTRADVMTGADGRSKGCGIVEYSTEEGAKEAVVTLNDTELNGRQIFVREDREERGSGSSGNRFSSDDQAQSRRVYVGNLSWDVAWQDLKDHMRDVGEVVHAEVIAEANGRSKGCGIVEYATPKEAQDAIKTLNDSELKGRMIFVREDRETNSGSYHGGAGGGGGFGGRGGGAGGGTSVYVWNLAYETSWQDLKDHCRAAGNVEQATILTNPEGRSLGCGVVVYQNPKEASRAIRELQNSELNGRPMYLRKDRVQSGGRGRPRGGRGYQGGRGGGSRGGGASSGCQLFVGNLSFDTSWQDLKDHFRQCGDVEHVEVMETPDGRKKGFGTVRFSSTAEAEAAISSLNGIELQGRALEVRLDHKA